MFFFADAKNNLKMYQIESVFIENQQNEALIKSEVQTEILSPYRVGDVIRLAENKFILNCMQCLQSFQHFSEFILHIEEHFIQSDAFILPQTIQNDYKIEITSNIQEEPPKSIEYNYSNEQEVLNPEIVPKVDPDSQYTEHFIENGSEFQFQPESKDDIKKLMIQQVQSGPEVVAFDLTQIIEGVTYQKVDNRFECMICRSKFSSKSNLRSHIGVHVKTKHVLCPICMKGFKNIHYVQKHIKSIHKQTITTNEIRKAQNTVKQIVKPKKSERNDHAADDVTKLKLNVLSSNYWRTEGKTFHCPLCVQWFAVPKYVQKHIRLVHGQHLPIEDILAAQIEPELKPEPTKSVELVQQQQYQSLEREQAKDIVKREKLFECFACHRMFVSEKALRYHQPLHEGIEYACPLCNKYFLMQKYVRDHMIYRHGYDKKSKLPPLKTRKIDNFEYHKPIVSRFECYLCRRTYPSRSKLNSHMKSHLDVLECSICMKVFKSTESRRRHIQLHKTDPNVQHHCLICNKTFPVR